MSTKYSVGCNSYNFEDERLETFKDCWSHGDIVTDKDLAKNGFYYLKKDDNTACAFCRIIIGAWEFGDDVKEEHKRLSPNCPFVNDLPTGNIPLEVCHLLPCRVGPRRYDLVSSHLRQKSYVNWPHKDKLPAKAMADAGFYYYGLSDNVRCYYCGQGLRNWNATHDPVSQHDWLIGSQCHLRRYEYNYETVNTLVLALSTTRMCLNLNFRPDHVHRALKYRLEQTNMPFNDLRECMTAVHDLNYNVY